MIVKREHFTLEKVKIKSDELIVGATTSGSKNGQVSKGSGSITYTDEPHPDLHKAVGRLTHYLRLVYPFKGEFVDKVVADGMSISGSSKGVIITGIYEAPSGRERALNSDRILLRGDAYGWEDELLPIIQEIENEVYLYVEEGKTAELRIAFDDE